LFNGHEQEPPSLPGRGQDRLDVLSGWRLRFLSYPRRQLDPRVTGRVRIESDIVEQEPERDQVQLHRPRLEFRRELGNPSGNVAHAERCRVSVAEVLGDFFRAER
jgi:hypothetical protein